MNLVSNVIKTPSFTFKGADININCFSDTHGAVLPADNALETLRENRNDVFCKSGKGRANVTAICGDWFTNGNQKGYLTNPEKPLAMFQLDMLNGLISGIKNIAENTSAIFTPGNHEFDGGVKLLDKVLSNLDAEILMTNLDIENSAGFETSVKEHKIINQKILEVEDDKSPELKHKILFLGISPVNMSAYKKNLDGVNFIDNVNKNQKSVVMGDYSKTLEDCRRRIECFKKENPKGFAVLLSHTGVNFADNLAKNSQVDLIFDGHEHKDETRFINGVPIVSLSMNFKKIFNADIKFDDDGNLESIKIKEFEPMKTKQKGSLSALYNKIFKDDLKPIYTVKTDKPEVKSLDLDGICTGNSYLANFVTDSIMEELQKENPDVDFLALNSSAIRHGIKPDDKASVSNFDLKNILSGIKSEDSAIFITDITGKELIDIILDNYLSNISNPKKNPIFHYSGLITDRTNLIKAFKDNAGYSELAQYILNAETNSPIDIYGNYKIANIEKYFNKSLNSRIKEMKEKSQDTGINLKNLFEKHFNPNGIYCAKCDVRIN